MRLLPTLFMISALTACSSYEPTPPGLPAQDVGALARITVKEQVRRASIDVDRRTGEISAKTERQVTALLATAPTDTASNIHIYLRGAEESRLLLPLGQVLVRDGIDPNKIVYDSAPRPPGTASGAAVRHDGGRLAVEILAVTYVAVPQQCPLNSHLDTMDGSNTPTSNFGCAYAADMAAQIADPADLLRGQSGGATDSVVTSGAIQRLRDNKTTPFTDTAPTSSGGGGT